MIDARKLLDQFLGTQVPGLQGSVKDKATQAINLARDNPMATSAIAGVLLGTKTGRQVAGNTLVLGGLAAIAGLGYQAYKNYQAGNAPTPAPQPTQQAEPQFLPPPSNSGFSTAPAIASNDFALSLVRAMIAAARADGHIDDAERQHILGKVQQAGVGAEAEAFSSASLPTPSISTPLSARHRPRSSACRSMPHRVWRSSRICALSVAISIFSPAGSVSPMRWSIISRRRSRVPRSDRHHETGPVAFRGRLA